MNELLTVTYAWWRNKRPIQWTVAEHLKQPTVNCKGKEEFELAELIARLIEQEGKNW